jgi:hypothetical protein
MLLTRLSFLAGLFISTPKAVALPIGFGYNQGDLTFMELESPNFRIYHDSRTPDEAKLTLNSLEAAKPHLERWFGVSRQSPLIVNMSAISDNASFANFVTDTIELQTLGQGGRDLSWHEYTHAMMYQHLNNWFGPAGAIIHLPWMEAWFIEGLAETMSVSVGSDEQAGVERYQALTGQWPSWDRIHSLYTTGPFSYRGYATSGAFVSWILKTHDANKLPQALQNFKSKSMPWYWPWAVTPFNDFLPMDETLKVLTGEPGQVLYEQYKRAATDYWTAKTKRPLLIANMSPSSLLSSPWRWSFERGSLIKKQANDQVLGVLEVVSDAKRAWVHAYDHGANDRRLRIGLSVGDGKTKWIKRHKSTLVDGLWLGASDVWWLETTTQTSRLCSAPVATFTSRSVKCSLKTTMPFHLRNLGSHASVATNETTTIWLAQDHETVTGDSHRVIEVQLASGQRRYLNLATGGRPISMAVAGQSRWVLMGDRSQRSLVKLDDKDSCLEMIELADFPVRIVGSQTMRPNLIVFAADGYGAAQPDPGQFPASSCKQLSSRTSPLLETLRSQRPLTLAEALKASDIWTDDAKTVDQSKNNSAPVSNVIHHDQDIPSSSKPSKWRGRPIFAFPWLGADDPLGPQIGVISVPLMDEMQNETVRLTMLYGAMSRFPYQEISIISNRYAPTWSASGFRAQVYNGRYRKKTDQQIYSSYLEEAGGHIDGVYSQTWQHLGIDYAWGMKASTLKPYIGSAQRVGSLNEIYGTVGLSLSNRSLYANSSLRARVAPAGINKTFQYDVIGLQTSSGVLIGAGKLELGLEGSRTRGPKRRDLQEMYVPLKTVIPGSGAGLNQTNFAITDDFGLFSPVFGDNQARAKFLATYPLIRDIDKFITLLYLERLVVSGFYNYGTAWRNKDLPPPSELQGAHGYSLDLFLDNKGVHFNVGLGVGQVVTKPWQGYWTFGFDALF